MHQVETNLGFFQYLLFSVICFKINNRNNGRNCIRVSLRILRQKPQQVTLIQRYQDIGQTNIIKQKHLLVYLFQIKRLGSKNVHIAFIYSYHYLFVRYGFVYPQSHYFVVYSTWTKLRLCNLSCIFLFWKKVSFNLMRIQLVSSSKMLFFNLGKILNFSHSL